MHNFLTSKNRTQSNADKYTYRQHLFDTDDVLPMWVADMDINAPECVISAVKNRAAHEIYGYEKMPDSAFEAQISWMQQHHNLHVKREWMCYSPSVVATISIAIRAYSFEGDGVIIQPPVYAAFENTIKNNSREVIKNPLKRDTAGIYRFDLEDLKSKITYKTKLLILCSPHNPVGRVWHQSELQELAEICLENNIRVLSDEIHSDLVYAPHIHTPFIALDEAVRNITVTAIGPGKSFNLTGLSISTSVIAEVMMRETFLSEYESIHFGDGAIFGHVAFESAYKYGAPWLDALLEHLRLNQDKLQFLLQQHEDKITWSFPEGTYLAWLKCDNMALENDALSKYFVKNARLGLSPGLAFGKEGSGFMRLNFAVSTDVMDKALHRLEYALKGFET